MDRTSFERDLLAGEGLTVEFKRCGNQPGSDFFETVCSFANRQGGSIYLGVLDDATVEGVPAAAVRSIERNISNVLANPDLFLPSPTVDIDRVDLDDKTVLRVWVPSGETAFRYKGEFYDRVADTDVRVRSADQISLLFLRKQGRYSERRVYPFVTMADLRADVIARARAMALARSPQHPWGLLDDEGLLRSARLYARDRETGQEGFTLAAVMLFGTDDVILDICPAYRTDAVARVVDQARYDDRLVVETNLLDAYDLLVGFLRRNTPDKFHLQGNASVSLRDIIVRELVANMLMHREFTSPFPAKLVVDGEAIRTENASRSAFTGAITLGNFNPVPKNPTIAHVFLQIGLAEELGSGMRNLTECSMAYSGRPPILEDGDVFRATVYLPGSGLGSGTMTPVPAKMGLDGALGSLLARGEFTSRELSELAGCSLRTAQRRLRALVDSGALSMREELGRMVFAQR